MVREMYDSTSPGDIPKNAQMVAYYVDGKYAWPKSWIDQFPNSVKVTISAVGVKTAMVGDVEDGCIWPPENAVPWVLRARAAGEDPTIYCNQLNDWQWVAAEFEHAGVPEPHWWVANYDGRATIPDGAVAKQYKHPPQLNNKHYDLSVVRDYWPGVDKMEDFMAKLTEEEQQELLKKTREIWSALWDTETAPIVGGGPGTRETVQDTVQRVAKRQQDHIDFDHTISKSVANIETVVNELKKAGAAQGIVLTDAQAEAFTAKVLAALGNTVKAASKAGAAEALTETEYAPRPNTK